MHNNKIMNKKKQTIHIIIATTEHEKLSHPNPLKLEMYKILHIGKRIGIVLYRNRLSFIL